MNELDAKPVNVLDVPCTICNAKPGERCTSVLEATLYREPHARRRELARKGS